jgi:hypothetical protein
MDHKKLLKKYIKHVYEVEGSMFLPSIVHDTSRKDDFTKEEIKELELLSEEK